ncbi:MAG: trypsin-like peptidase domain-containing protein [Phycisphaerales bacterium]|nr:trypsin-like peptidase domain-containing protein [Phycisphaerales bacterium]
MKRTLWAGVLAIAAFSLLPACTPLNPAHIDIRPDFAVRYALDTVSPAVVRIDVVTEDFSQGQPRSSRSLGSGVIIDKEGHILTNFHVAGRAKRLDVTLFNQEHVRARLVGSDHWTDLALIQLDLNEIHEKKLAFNFAPLGKSSEVSLGQPVMAVGTPYGLTRTVTKGIISNADRYFEESSIDQYETGWFNNWLQMDAAINPGNSGGPLINLRGEVIGINTRGYLGSNSLGFAIPIDVAQSVVADLLAKGKVTRSYIGVQLQPLQDLEKFYDMASGQGVLIANVEKDSPAATAGLQTGDILLAVNDKPVNARFPEQLAAVRKLISDFPVGTALKLQVRRSGGSEIAVSVTTEQLESKITEEKSIAAWGLSVRNVTRAYLREQRIPYVRGALVTGTKPGSPGVTANIRIGDIIIKVGGKPVASVEELEAAVAAWQKKNGLIDVSVQRDRAQIVLVIKP